MKRQGLWGKKQENKEIHPPLEGEGQSLHPKALSGGEGKVSEDNDLLVGMKAICAFTGYSESTIEKFRQEYDEFPVMNNGRLIMSKTKWNKFWTDVFEKEAEGLKI